ncbi:MAG: hypothetical protein JWP02_523 [Acidimicrobiales bacterium]|nr:hypothetical protein [Acidimicrobiales bacterium]
MFFPGSRYAKTGTYLITRLDGTQLAVAKLPLPPQREHILLLGYHPRRDEQRLDAIANHYLSDPNGFWRLADANVAVVPDALGARRMIGIPRAGA